MSDRRDIRRLAMQILYQIDLRGEDDIPEIIAAQDDVGFDRVPVRREAARLAEAAWAGRAEADGIVAALAPDWPTHRQPPLDRAILRIAHHEMVSGHAPVKVAINEAVELAKQYGSEHSPSFINGVLDKMARRLAASAKEREPKDPVAP